MSRVAPTPAPEAECPMQSYARSHLSDEALLRDLAAATARERGATAEVLALIAEVDDRKLYLPAGYASMYAYCVGELHLSEDAACKRITAARAARQVPEILPAIAAGRLHLSAVVLLAPHLTEGNAKDLLLAATHKTRKEVEQLLAQRFPKSEMVEWVEPISASPAPAADLSAPGRINLTTRAMETERHSEAEPLSAQSFAVQFTMSSGAHEHLRYAQALLGHEADSGDIARVIERALAVYVAHLEKRKFGATDRPRRVNGRPSKDPRHIPARVRRAVWERDQGRCTFVGEGGHRCEARRALEFDHVLEVARGGEATVDGVRLLCRAHNQHAAERTFGAEFMRHKRIAAAEFRAAAEARRDARARRQTAGKAADDKDVVPWLRALGFSAAEARRGAERCEHIPDATLEDRVRHALSCFRVRGTHVAAPLAAAT